jgi:hypothetical protein
MRIIVGSAMNNWLLSRPGAYDNRMAYVLSLQRLGHEVYLMGGINSQQSCDAHNNPVPFDKWEGRDRLEKIARSYDIWPRCCLIYNDGEATHGMPFRDAVQVAKAADLLINISGRLRIQEIVGNVACRAYIDLDPGITQVYYVEYGIDKGFDQHQYFFTVGLNMGTATCGIPTCGLTWHPMMHPVVLELWPARIDPQCQRFTSVSSWGQQTFDYAGRYSGEKLDNWRRFLELPQRARQALEIAMNVVYDENRALFREHGWVLSDPEQLDDLAAYRSFIGHSRAEFSIAHHGFVQFKTGWFSDRSARYLASGKPVLVQATGIEDYLPTGKGLLTFTTMEEAVAGIEAINKDYIAHCRAARAIAAEYCAADKVLPRMLEQMGF